MKLQVNARGAWRDVAEFEPEQLRAVLEAVVPLARALAIDTDGGNPPSFRVIKTASRSPKVAAYLYGPKFKWRKR